MSTYTEWGYDSFLIRTILIPTTQSPLEARNAVPIGVFDASLLSTPLNATTDVTFSSTDADTAAWTTGVIYFADGTNSGTIDAGNTGDIAATSYIYYDREKLGVLQTATDPADATGMGKFLIAVVEEGASGKDCKITPTIAAGLVVSGIEADQIKAGTITATEIATGTITATQISGNQLDAVATNTGTLNVDEYINVGAANVKIDGANTRIVMNDGTTNRVVIGNV